MSETLEVRDNEWTAAGTVLTATKTFTLQTREDDEYEGDETITLRNMGFHNVFVTPALVDHPPGAETATVTIVDDDPLGVSSIEVTSTPTGGYYDVGDTIQFNVEFNGAVTVTGTPQFAFELGGQTRQAAYARGSDSKDLVFSYTFAATDRDDYDGISWRANSLSLSGGTIKFMHTDPAEQVNAALTHAAQGALPDHKADTAKPTLRSTLAVETTKTLTLTYSEALNTAAPAASAFTVRVSGNSGVNPTGVSILGRVVTLTMAADFTGGHTTVTYTKPSTNPLRSLSGKEADALTNRTIRTAPPLPVGVVFESHLFTVKEGETVSVAVWLNRDPERTFTIPIWKTYDGVGVNDFNFPDGVTFNSGEIFKELTFTATEDQLDENGQQVGLRFGTPPPGVTPGFPRQSAVYIIDEDGAGVSVSTSTISVARGESEMYTLVLATLPTGDVTVTPLSREGHVTFSPPAITFTPNDWDMPKRVTVRASATAGGIDTIAHTVSGYGQIAVASPLHVSVTGASARSTQPGTATSVGGGFGGGGSFGAALATPQPTPTSQPTPTPQPTPQPTPTPQPPPQPTATATATPTPPDDGAVVPLWLWLLLVLLAVAVAAGGYVYYARARRGR